MTFGVLRGRREFYHSIGGVVGPHVREHVRDFGAGAVFEDFGLAVLIGVSMDPGEELILFLFRGILDLGRVELGEPRRERAGLAGFLLLVLG